MSESTAFLRALVAADGQTVVIDSGQVPYLVAAGRYVEMRKEPLDADAIESVLADLLPETTRATLARLGAIECEHVQSPELPDEYFTVVAVRWASSRFVEIRRDVLATAVASSDGQGRELPVREVEPVKASGASGEFDRDVTPGPDWLDAIAGAMSRGWDRLWHRPPRTHVTIGDVAVPVAAARNAFLAQWPAVSSPVSAASAATDRQTVVAPTSSGNADALDIDVDPLWSDQDAHRSLLPATDAADVPAAAQTDDAGERDDDLTIGENDFPFDELAAHRRWTGVRAASHFEGLDLPSASELFGDRSSLDISVRPSSDATLEFSDLESLFASAAAGTLIPTGADDRLSLVKSRGKRASRKRSRPAVQFPPLAARTAAAPGLAELVGSASKRGASALYVSVGAQPVIRINGDIEPLHGAALMGASELESLLLASIPDALRETFRRGRRIEWANDVPHVGLVLAVAFYDGRGPNGSFRLTTARPQSADELELGAEVQALALEPEGLLLVAGRRLSGRSALIAAFVDLMSRVRRDHIITLENEPHVVYERRQSIISQRSVRGGSRRMLAAFRAALREDPDVVVVDELGSDRLIRSALKATTAGHLVIGGMPARTAPEAIGRILDAYPASERRHAERLLAENLRGVLAQVSLRRRGGGREIARDVLINTRAVSSLIAEGQISDLGLAITKSRSEGMASLNDTLVDLVRSGAVDIQEAYRNAGDRPSFLTRLKQDGVDASLLEPRPDVR